MDRQLSNKQLGRRVLSAGATGLIAVLLVSGLSCAARKAIQKATAPASVSEAAGTLLDPAQYQGRVTYLDFWASWCTACRASFPWMNEMQEKYGDEGLAIIAVNLDRDREQADAFLAEFPVKFEVVYDPGADLAQAYDLEGMPCAFLYGRDGKLRESHVGFRAGDEDDLERSIQSLLSEVE